MNHRRAERLAASPPARRLGVAVLVLAGHALLATGLTIALRPGRAPPAAAAAPPMLWLRLPLPPAQPRPADAAAVSSDTPRARPPRETEQARPSRARPVVESRAITLPAPDAADPAAPGVADRAAAAQAPASHPVPLDLSLPRTRQTTSGWARGETRLPAPESRDERLARTLGTDTTLREEARGEQRRFRRGTACVDTRPARIGQLDPFNQSTHPSPRLAEPC